MVYFPWQPALEFGNSNHLLGFSDGFFHHLHSLQSGAVRNFLRFKQLWHSYQLISSRPIFINFSIKVVLFSLTKEIPVPRYSLSKAVVELVLRLPAQDCVCLGPVEVLRLKLVLCLAENYGLNIFACCLDYLLHELKHAYRLLCTEVECLAGHFFPVKVLGHCHVCTDRIKDV